MCEEVGADVTLVADGMGLDRRIGPQFLRPGIGYGGSCFPKDVSALKQLAGNSGYHFQLLTSVIEVNELQKRRVVGKLRKHLGSLRERTVVLLGLAFKPDTNDIREASSLVLAMRLLAEGAHVRAWDPVTIEVARPHLPGVELCEDLLEAVSGADAAVVVTEWNELRSLPRPEVRTAMRIPLIVDGRNFSIPTPCGGQALRTRGSGDHPQRSSRSPRRSLSSSTRRSPLRSPRPARAETTQSRPGSGKRQRLSRSRQFATSALATGTYTRKHEGVPQLRGGEPRQIPSVRILRGETRPGRPPRRRHGSSSPSSSATSPDRRASARHSTRSRCASLMTRYFEEMRSVLESHGGVVEKYIGDAVMAVFGLPVVREDDALRAVRPRREECERRSSA